MANPTIFNYALQDDQGLPNNTDFFVAYDGATETVDALIGAWTSYGTLLDACIDAKIKDGSITIPLIRNSAWKATAVNGNNVNQVMVLNFANDFNSYASEILIPAYKEALVNTASPKAPNLAQTNLAAFIAAVIGGYASEVFPNSSSLHDLNALIDAFLTTRKVRGQRTKTKVTP